MIPRDSELWARYRKEILQAWARGEAVTEMRIRTDSRQARGGYLSVPTMQNYVRDVYEELGVQSAPAAVARGIALGYLPCCPNNCHLQIDTIKRHEDTTRRRAEDASDVHRHAQRWGG